MTRSSTMSETSLAAAIVAHFRSYPGADVYQEVEYGGRADIVVVTGRVVHVVECKTKFGIKVLEQAVEWLPIAHRVSIATPAYSTWDRPPTFHAQLVEGLGIGWLMASRGDYEDKWTTREVVSPRLRRRVGRNLRGALKEEHKTFAEAGNNAGKFWSPWRATCKALRDFVARNPGCTLKDAIDGIEHHYGRDSTARSSMSHWIGAKELGVEWREVEGRRGLYAVPDVGLDAVAPRR